MVYWVKLFPIGCIGLNLWPAFASAAGGTGLDHHGCYRVVTTSTSIGLLEGTTDELRDSPFFRRDAVNKCARAAMKKSYDKFGVAFGYCISGSSDTRDYTEGGSSRICSSAGTGGWSPGTGYSMDVYIITDSSEVPVADTPLNSPNFAAPVEAEGYGDSDGGGGFTLLEALSEDDLTEIAGSSSAATSDHRYSVILLAPVLLITLVMSTL